MRKAGVILVLVFYCFTTSAQNWQQAGFGGDYVSELLTDTTNNVLYGLGGFNTVTGDKIVGVAKYDGTKWDSVGQSLYVYSAMSMHNGELYVAGQFSPSIYSWVYKWNGVNWDTIGDAFDNAILDMLVYKNELYALGLFGSVGSKAITCIAKWDGMNWGSVDTSFIFFLCPTTAAIEYKDELYVGGEFITTLGRYIVKWDGSNWKSVGTELEQACGWFGNDFSIEDFAIYRGELYVAGCIEWLTDQTIGNNIAKWDGSKWLDVGGGTDKPIKDLVVYQDILYAVGESDQAGGVPADEIALWNGVEWCGLGNTFQNGILNTAEVFNNELYVGGGFTKIDGDTINGVAKWTGGNYTDTCGVITGVKEDFEVKNGELRIYPNPTEGLITFEIELPETVDIEIQIRNVLGQLLYKKSFGETQKIRYDLNLRDLPNGVYFVKLVTPENTVNKRIVITR